MSGSRRCFLTHLFQAAVSAVRPEVCLAPHIPDLPTGRTLVVGVGKASSAMSSALQDLWSGPLSGLVVTRYGHAVSSKHIETVEAAHPVPDIAGYNAASRILTMAKELGHDDLLLCLISGGGSALATLPAGALTLRDKQVVSESLLRSGAAIREINCVRKHLSAIKGGRLAVAASPAKIITLAISDVPGDDVGSIASGPTVADPTSLSDALNVLRKYSIDAPAAVWDHLAQEENETPKPGDPRLARSHATVIATSKMMLEAVALEVGQAGMKPVILGDALEGESRDVALKHAAIVRSVLMDGDPVKPPAVLLSGGETTVTVRGKGRGGRNAEFLLALADELGGAPGVFAIACDTDGIDGTEENAGALILPDTLRRATLSGLDAKVSLADNDSYGFFSTLGDTVITGPTLTNVNDFRAILIES